MPQTMSIHDALCVCNATVGQWIQALREGINPAEYATLLKSDLETIQQALNVLTDWHGEAVR